MIVKEHLEEALRSGKKLRVKFGVDPTAPDLHLGHAVALRKLREFQDLGHTVVLIIGDFTARIGDPSGRSKTRPSLKEGEIAANAGTYFEQAGKFLDISKTEVRYNSEWFDNKNWALHVAEHFTAQRILERDDFTKRMKGGVEVHMNELLYPMMQAYDSVMVKADVELGGNDQKFNMLAGRDLQRHMGLPEQDVVMVPLLRGVDGVHKMSKSLGNHIGTTEEPNVMFGKVMSIPDELIGEYYELCLGEKPEVSNPRESKLELAKRIVDLYHDESGEAAKKEFIRVFSKKEKPQEIPEVRVGVKSMPLVELLVAVGTAKSKSEARRLVEQGAVKIDDVKQSDAGVVIDLSSSRLAQVGPRKFVRVKP